VPKRVIPEKMDSKYVNASKHQWVITYQLFVQLLTLLYSSLVKVIQISNPKYYRLVAFFCEVEFLGLFFIFYVFWSFHCVCCS
jgi:hypothetical protein